MAFTMEQYRESARTIQSRLGGFVPRVAMILGSGLGELGDEVETPIFVDYRDIPHFRASTAPVMFMPPALVMMPIFFS